MIRVFSVFILLVLSLPGNAQVDQKQKGIHAYPVYYLQGLDVNADSTSSGLYDWLRLEDRNAVFSGDSLLKVEGTDILPKGEVARLPLAESIKDSSYQKIEDDFTPRDSTELDLVEIDLVPRDSTELDVAEIDLATRDSVLFESLSADSLEVANEIEFSLDSLAHQSDSLKLHLVEFDSLSISETNLANVQIEIQTDSIYSIPAEQVDSLSVTTHEESLDLHTVRTGQTIEIDTLDVIDRDDSIEAEIQVVDSIPAKTANPIEKSTIKSQSSVLNSSVITEQKLDTVNTRRSLVPNTRNQIPRDQPAVVQHRVDTVVVVQRIIEQAPVYSETFEKEGSASNQKEKVRSADTDKSSDSKDSKGNSADITETSRTSDVQRDADRRVQEAIAAQRRAEAALALALAAQVDSSTKPVKPDSVLQVIQKPDSSIVPSVEPVVHTRVIVPAPETKLLISQDTAAEKAVSQLALRMDQVATQVENNRQADNQIIDSRFDRLENKMDALLQVLLENTEKEEVIEKPLVEEVVRSEEMNIYFAVNSHGLSTQQLMEIQSFVRVIDDTADAKINLSGFADNTGNAAYNMKLVNKRLASVKEALISLGFSPSNVGVNNYGQQKADTSKNYNQLDRRVSLQLFIKEISDK